MNDQLPPKDTELFVFDIDGTLVPFKSAMTKEMVPVFADLLAKKKVALISGGSFEVFKIEFAEIFASSTTNLQNLFLFPTCGASFFIYDGSWKEVYRHKLRENEKQKIINAFNVAVPQSKVQMPTKTYGEVLEDRGTQITFSALGQLAPLLEKTEWDKDQKKRFLIKDILDKLLPEFEVRIGGSTSLDVTRKGIDKAYGIKMMEEHLHIPIDKMFFIGDALFPGGNDYPVISTGIKTLAVKDQNETLEFIKSIL